MPPRRRDYAKEYAARKRRYKDLPTKVARGHGEVPAEIALAAEKGTLTREQAAKYRRGLAAYQEHYGPAKAGRKGHKLPGEHLAMRTFRTREDAEAYAENELGLSPEYYRTRKVRGTWVLTLLR